MFRNAINKFVALSLVTLTLGFSSEAEDTKEVLKPEERALKDCFVALKLKDKSSILRQIMPNPDADVLWEGKKPSMDKLTYIYMNYNNLCKFKACKVGEEFDANGIKIKVTDQMVNATRAIVVVHWQNRFHSYYPLYFINGSWRVNADQSIAKSLSEKGRKPTEVGSEYWSKIENFEQLLKGKPCLWYINKTQFINKIIKGYFNWATKERTTASYPKDPKDPKDAALKELKMFDQPVVKAFIKFEGDYISALEAILYDRKDSPKSLKRKEFGEKINKLAKLISKFCESKGFKRKIRKTVKGKRIVTESMAWVINEDTTLSLNWSYLKKKIKKKGETKTKLIPESIQILANAFDTSSDPRCTDLDKGFVESSKSMRDFLAELGIGKSPYERDFWEQKKIGFLGYFVENYDAFWTPEQKKGKIEEFRSCYLRNLENRIVNGGEKLGFINNKPLIDANIRLFNSLIVAMRAVFFDGKLVQFSFDFWNKGDVPLSRAYTSANVCSEKETKKIFKGILERFKKAGAKIEKTRSSKDKFARVPDKREMFRTGFAKITLSSKRKEYYTVKIENINFEAYKKIQLAQAAERRGNDLRKNVKEKIIVVSKPHPEKSWEKEGDTYLDVPMVDQGAKGYCAPATVLRVLKWFGHDATMNEMAAFIHTKGLQGGGTSIPNIIRGVKKIARKQKLKFEKIKLLNKKELQDPLMVEQWIDTNFIGYIDQGVPVYWCNRNHIRLVIGYNAKSGEVLMSDSWGNPGYDRYKFNKAIKDTRQMMATH